MHAGLLRTIIRGEALKNQLALKGLDDVLKVRPACLPACSTVRVTHACCAQDPEPMPRVRVAAALALAEAARHRCARSGWNVSLMSTDCGVPRSSHTRYSKEYLMNTYRGLVRNGASGLCS